MGRRAAGKSGSILVSEGVVTARSAVVAAHRIRYASGHWAVGAVRRHPALHGAADQVLRRSGVARLTYGKL